MHSKEEILREEILKYILTVNPKVKGNKSVEEHIERMREYYPKVTEETFLAFHSALMGKDPSKRDDFIRQKPAELGCLVEVAKIQSTEASYK